MAAPQYGREHQARRARMLPKAIGRACRRCGKPMMPWQDLDAGHGVDVTVDRRSKADAIEHTSCNRSAGGKLGNARARFRPSRSW